jgi:hypothetical protein
LQDTQDKASAENVTNCSKLLKQSTSIRLCCCVLQHTPNHSQPARNCWTLHIAASWMPSPASRYREVTHKSAVFRMICIGSNCELPSHSSQPAAPECGNQLPHPQETERPSHMQISAARKHMYSTDVIYTLGSCAWTPMQTACYSLERYAVIVPFCTWPAVCAMQSVHVLCQAMPYGAVCVCEGHCQSLGQQPSRPLRLHWAHPTSKGMSHNT